MSTAESMHIVKTDLAAVQPTKHKLNQPKIVCKCLAWINRHSNKLCTSWPKTQWISRNFTNISNHAKTCQLHGPCHIRVIVN